MTFHELITTWKLNRVMLAEQMNMPLGTFKNKLNPMQEAYHFTVAEEKQLKKVLSAMRNDIGKTKGQQTQ